MFEKASVSRLLALHEKSFGLFHAPQGAAAALRRRRSPGVFRGRRDVAPRQPPGLPLTDGELNRRIGEHPALAPRLALATYTNELHRRARFAGQGEGVPALRREVAWGKDGRPDRKFCLKADAILAAESAIREGLRRLAG